MSVFPSFFNKSSCFSFLPQLPATKFNSILDFSCMSQNVNGFTNIDGHRLDLVITREANNLITGSFVSELIGDHFAIRSFIKARRPPRPRKAVTYRELEAIDDHFFI